MAASSSDDASDIFWPGYVDAIANLAINLLFVIAVMAIVVIGASLQIAELMKRKDSGYLQEIAGSRQKNSPMSNPGALPEKADLKARSNTVSPALLENSTGPSKTSTEEVGADTQPVDKIDTQKSRAAAAQVAAVEATQSSSQDATRAAKLQSDLEKLQELNQQLQANLKQARRAQRLAEQQATDAAQALAQAQAQAQGQGRPQARLQAQGEVDTSVAKQQALAIIDPNSEVAIEELEREGKAETVVARTAQPAQPGQGATAINVRTSGLLVRFKEGALELSTSEASEVLTKLNTYGPVDTTRWRITVVAPKGFSEALRLAYYRANSVRNVLVANGVPGVAIDLRVFESTRTSADNTIVSVRPQP